MAIDIRAKQCTEVDGFLSFLRERGVVPEQAGFLLLIVCLNAFTPGWWPLWVEWWNARDELDSERGKGRATQHVPEDVVRRLVNRAPFELPDGLASELAAFGADVLFVYDEHAAVSTDAPGGGGVREALDRVGLKEARLVVRREGQSLGAAVMPFIAASVRHAVLVGDDAANMGLKDEGNSMNPSSSVARRLSIRLHEGGSAPEKLSVILWADERRIEDTLRVHSRYLQDPQAHADALTDY